MNGLGGEEDDGFAIISMSGILGVLTWQIDSALTGRAEREGLRTDLYSKHTSHILRRKNM